MKKKIVCMMMAMTMTASAALVGCGSSETTASSDAATATEAASTDAEESEDSSGDNVLKLGIECTYTPYNWTQESEELPNGEKAVKIENADGYAYGYDVALAQKICDQLGWELEVYKSDWTSIFMGLEDGTYDCIMSGVAPTEERELIYDFTTTYYHRSVVAVVRSDSEYVGITGLSQFDGMSPNAIGQMGTIYQSYKTEIPSYVDAVDYESSAELYLAVQNGTADVLVADKATAESALKTMDGLTVLELADDDDFTPPEGSTNDCCILYRGGDKECDVVSEAMAAMGWSADTDEGLQAMDDLMMEMIELQPSSN